MVVVRRLLRPGGPGGRAAVGRPPDVGRLPGPRAWLPVVPRRGRDPRRAGRRRPWHGPRRGSGPPRESRVRRLRTAAGAAGSAAVTGSCLGRLGGLGVVEVERRRLGADAWDAVEVVAGRW